MYFLGYLFDILSYIHLQFILQFSIDLGSCHTPSVCGLYGRGGGVALPVGLLTIFQQIKAQATRLDLLWSQPVGPDGDGSNPNWCRVKPSHLARKKRLNSLGISQVWSRISAEVSIFLPGMNKIIRYQNSTMTGLQLTGNSGTREPLHLEHWQNICLDDRFSWKTPPFHRMFAQRGPMGQSSLGPYFWNCWHRLPWLLGSSQPDLPAKESTGDTKKIKLNDF